MTEPILNDLCLSLIDALQKAAKGLSNPTANEYHRIAWAKDAYKEAEHALSTLISLEPLTTNPNESEPVKSPEISNGKGLTLEEISDWVYKCSRDPENNRWVTRVRFGNPKEHEDAVVVACAALHDLGHHYSVNQLQPIPVESRVPGPDDLDERGRCWLRRKYEPDGPTWRLFAPASLFDGALQLYYKEWLPHHALPLFSKEIE